ncbi:hypothetical protein BHE74_00008440 [Ensete ventricosum]|nr:hypothetical protein BHE74_00008440 [Ensete ventricosum]
MVVPAYRVFYERCRPMLRGSGAGSTAVVRFSPEDVRNRLNGMFSGSTGSVRTLREKHGRTADGFFFFLCVLSDSSLSCIAPRSWWKLKLGVLSSVSLHPYEMRSWLQETSVPPHLLYLEGSNASAHKNGKREEETSYCSAIYATLMVGVIFSVSSPKPTWLGGPGGVIFWLEYSKHEETLEPYQLPPPSSTVPSPSCRLPRP